MSKKTQRKKFLIYYKPTECYTERRFEGGVPFGELFIGLDGLLYSYENFGMELVVNQDDYEIVIDLTAEVGITVQVV